MLMNNIDKELADWYEANKADEYNSSLEAHDMEYLDCLV